MTVLCLSLSVTTAHPGVYSILETPYWLVVRSTDCREKSLEILPIWTLYPLKPTPVGMFFNQWNKNDIQPVYGYFL